MTTLYINDREVTVPAGTSIMEACRKHEIEVPHFCYHPELSVAANCRMCLVEIEGWPKPAASCCTPVTEGMKVSTQTPGLSNDRKMVMEYLLINHPLDCPVCDQGGDCKLQNYSIDYGAVRGRYAEAKRAPVNYDLGPFINTCMTRSIHCTRCVRFANEIAGTGDMGVLGRGDRMTIVGIVEECLSSELSGNLADICPVGALLDKPSHDVSRPWELTHHKSTCTMCPQGCDIKIESRGDEVIRIQPVAGSPEPWICDRGRYAYDAFRSEERIVTPLMVENGKMMAVNWDDACSRAVNLLADKRVGIVFSPDWSVEGLAAIRLLRDGAFPDARMAFDLHRRDMRPFAFEEGFAMTTQQIEDVDQVVILGSDLRQRLPLVMQRLRSRLRHGKPVVRLGAMNYRTNTTIARDALIRPREWPGVIARAMDQVMDVGKQAAGMREWLAAVEDRHEAGKLLADALLSDSCALLVGEEIRSHPDAAALICGIDLLVRGCGHAEEGRDGRNLIPEGMNAQALSVIYSDIRTSVGDLCSQAANGDLDALLLIGSDPLGDGLFPCEAEAAMEKVPLVQVGAIRGKISKYAAVILPAAAYSEVDGSFINVEGRVRVARHPIRAVGQERPLWKVMLRLLQALDKELPVTNLAELRNYVSQSLPELSEAWEPRMENELILSNRRNSKAAYLPDDSWWQGFDLDVISRYSMYREGMWSRASALLTEAGRIFALDDLLVHPRTLREAGLEPGEHSVRTPNGEFRFNIGVRDDVVPGVLFIGRRGIAAGLSSDVCAAIRGDDK